MSLIILNSPPLIGKEPLIPYAYLYYTPTCQASYSLGMDKYFHSDIIIFVAQIWAGSSPGRAPHLH